MKKLITILIFLSLVSCKKEFQTFSKNITIIQDTVQNLKIKNIKEKDYATSNIMYIGKIKDSVELLNNLFLPPPPEPLANSNEDTKWKKYRLKKEMIWEDLMKYLKDFHKYQLIKKENITLEFNEKDTIIGCDNFRGDFDSLIYYKSFPIYIKNISKDTINLGTDGDFPILVEGKNKNGKWVEINKFPFHCGTGSYSTICLPPNEIIITSMFHYKGNYKTKLRFKILDFVSREYDGSINEEQFR